MAFTTSGQETEWGYSYSPGAHTGQNDYEYDYIIIKYDYIIVCTKSQTRSSRMYELLSTATATVLTYLFFVLRFSRSAR